MCLLVCAIAHGEGDPLDEPHFSLAATRSIPIALQRFHRDQPKADERRFDVYIRESADVVEVEFVPEASPLGAPCGKSDCSIGTDSGGSIYGFGITYVIDKRTKKIAKTIRAR